MYIIHSTIYTIHSGDIKNVHIKKISSYLVQNLMR